MKRILSIILTTVLLLGVLAACGTTPAETTPTPTTPAQTTPPVGPMLSATAKYVAPKESLTDTQKTEILTAWQEKIGENIFWYDENEILTRHHGTRYYGTIDDYIMIGICKGGPAYTYIGTQTVYSFATCHVFAYRDGEFFEVLPDSIFSNFTTQLVEYHKNFEEKILAREDLDNPRYYGGNHPPLGDSPYTDAQLKEWSVQPVGSFNSEDGYLGTYNGYAVYASEGELRGIGLEEIGCVYFWWDQFFAVACKDGEVYMLYEAVDLGILNYDDLRAIAYYWYGETLPEL